MLRHSMSLSHLFPLPSRIQRPSMNDLPHAPRPVVVPGDRIYLGPVQRSDLPTFATWFADLELTAYIGGLGMSVMPEHEEQWYSSVVEGRNLKTFAIVIRETNQVIGSVSLQDINTRNGVAELGIAIGDKSVWGKGYGSEAVRLMADYGMTFCGLHTVYLWFVDFNQRGHHAYLKAGFKEAGRIRSFYLIDGKRYDRVLMDCTRQDLGPSRVRHLIGLLPE